MQKNILIINLRKIGDTVMATSAAYLLKRAYPNAKITMLVKPLTVSLVENNPVIDAVLTYDYSHEKKMAGLWTLIGKIRQREFSTAIVIDNKPRSALIAFLANIPERIGFEKITKRNWYLQLLYTELLPINYNFAETQQVKNHEIFINRLTGRTDEAKMILPIPTAEDKNKVDKFLALLPQKRYNIALCIHSGVAYKDWSIKKFAYVINKFPLDANFILVGGKPDKAAGIRLQAKSELPLYNFAGQTTLPALGYLLEQVDCLLSVDTGTAHICAAVGTPEIVIFAGTSHLHWAPYGDKVHLIYPQGLDCYPCSDEIRKKCDDYRCLDGIKPEAVLKELVSILNDICK